MLWAATSAPAGTLVANGECDISQAPAGTILLVAIDRDVVLRGALALPADERAEVAAELLASLDEPTQGHPDDVSAAWAQEFERRARRMISGEDPGEPWPEVRDRIRTKLAG